MTSSGSQTPLDEDDRDLFGDGGDSPLNQEARKLDDSELDSGDEAGRQDRVADTIEEDAPEQEERTVEVLSAEVPRIPEPDYNSELYILNLPPFLGLKPENFDPLSYEIPQAPHGADAPPADKFSPFSVASTTAFWRYDPDNESKLQSNTRIVRWSDGSLTLQIASQPRDHYRITTTALRQDFGPTKKPGEAHDYKPENDSHTYFAVPNSKAELMRLVKPFGAAMKILPSGEQTDESVLALQKSLASAETAHDPFASIRHVTEDPELAKKRAELAEKDKLRAERKREAQFERETGRKERVLGRRMGGGTRGFAGLTIDNLEDEDGMPQARAARRKPTAGGRRRASRRGDIYSDDEEDHGYHRGRTREDEYDGGDGFLVTSDEEPEIYDSAGPEEAEEDDPDKDDLEIDGEHKVIQSKSRSERVGTPKRGATEDVDGEDEDMVAAGGTPHVKKKRRVVEEDDDDDE